jgi:serine protease Do
MKFSINSRPLRLLALQLGLSAGLAVSIPASFGEEPSPRYTPTVLAIQRAEPAVVNIEGNKPSSSSNEGTVVNGMGAGVIVDSRGYILTNQHVIQDVSRIEVTLHDGTKHIGQLIDVDAATDLALIKLETNPKRKFPVIVCGTSSDLMRGEPVIAIGNPYGYHDTVTEGIISALHRNIPVNGTQDYPDLIQTDAPINPGNSGGPLLNAEGLMIGINAAVRIGAQGIGFAIPVDRAIEIAAKIAAEHRLKIENSPVVETTYYGGQAKVKVVAAPGRTDLNKGDIIHVVNGRQVRNRLEYELALMELKPNDEVSLEYTHDGKELTSTLRATGTRASTTGQLVSRSNKVVTAETADDVAYALFGLRLEPASPMAVRSIDSNYKGGLRVTSVRTGSPAYIAQIRPGDILVGLLEWQTPDWGDLAYIFNRSELKDNNSPKFHIMRGKELFWGNFEIGKSRVR